MRRIALSFVLALSAVSAFAQTDNSPKVFTNRFCVGTSATLNACTPTTFGVLDPTAGAQIIQVRSALDTTYPFLRMTHRTTVGGSNVRDFQFRIDSSGTFSVYDSVGAHTGLSIDSSGNATLPGTTTFSGLTASSLVATNSSKALTSTVSGLSPGFTGLSLSGLTASRLLVTDGSKALASNGAITTNAIPKSASSGATLAASAVSDDGTNVTTSEPLIFAGTNGATATCGWGSENLTLATGAATTDTTANLLPANSVIVAVVGRVTTTITAACTGWELGDASTAARFTGNDTTLTAGETQVGLKALAGGISTDATGPTQTSAAKVRVTCAGGNPGAGAIRIEVFSCSMVAPSS